MSNGAPLLLSFTVKRMSLNSILTAPSSDVFGAEALWEISLGSGGMVVSVGGTKLRAFPLKIYQALGSLRFYTSNRETVAVTGFHNDGTPHVTSRWRHLARGKVAAAFCTGIPCAQLMQLMNMPCLTARTSL
jgi:hypothetical protein